MKFHPFNIKYVEKISNSNKIIFHDDICPDKFKLRMDYKNNFQIEEIYDDTSKDVNNIYALMHTDISSYINNEKNFLLHGDIYFLKEENIYIIFSFLKYMGSSSIKNHGFFFLTEKVIGKEIQLLFKTKNFKNLHEFFTDYLKDESNLEYIGNLFVHDVEEFIFEPFSYNKTYKFDYLKERADSVKNNFHHHSNFILLEKKEYEVKAHDYKPEPITEELVRMNEVDCWEFSLERLVPLYNYNEGLKCESSVEFITGYFYECKIDEPILNIIKYKLSNKEEFPLIDERSINNYMKFFVFYTHAGISIQSITKDSLEDFYFDDIPIGFDVWDSFKIESNRNDKFYKEELLKIV